MIVEFVGLMGAGKTTLYERTVQALSDQGHRIWTPVMVGTLCGGHTLARTRRLAYRARASWWSRPAVSLAVRHLLMSGRPIREVVKALRWFLTCLGNHWTARQAIPANHIVMVDEGLVQKALKIFVQGPRETDLTAIKEYARALPLPDVLVYLKVNPEVAVRRAKARPQPLPPRFRSLDDIAARRTFEEAARVLDALVQEIRSFAPNTMDVIVVDTNDLDASRIDLDRFLRACPTSPRKKRAV